MRALLALAVVLVVAGCGGSEADFGSLQTRDLAAMPVPPAELGEAGRGLVVDAEESGYANDAVAAEDTLDPRDGARDLEAAGRVGGYNLGFWDEDLSRLVSRRGVVEVVTGVDLFRSPGDARAFLAGEVADYRRLEGTAIEDGVVLTAVRARQVDDLGDGGWVVQASAEIAGVAVHGTFVAFTRDRVVGTAVVTRADDADERERARALADKLLRRIERAARDELDERPVPLVDADARSASREAERLARLVLSPADLPRGARVIREGALPNGAYEREFDVSGVGIGRSRLLELQVRAEVAPSPAAAAVRLGEVRGRLRRAADAAEAFSREAGVELAGASTRELAAGADAVAFRVAGRAGGTPYVAVIVTVRVDRALGTVFAAGRAPAVRDADVLALSRTLRARMAERLRAA